MSKLTIIAHIYAKPEHIDGVKTELTKLLAPTREEAGYEQYDLHQDRKDPAHFFFYEIWESQEALVAHMGSPHIAAFGKAAKDMVAKSEIFELELVG